MEHAGVKIHSPVRPVLGEGHVDAQMPEVVVSRVRDEGGEPVDSVHPGILALQLSFGIQILNEVV